MTLKTKIFIDGPTEEDMKVLSNKVDGFTFNPTLFKNLGVKDYLLHCKKVIQISNDLPISLEVIGDDHETLLEQSKILSSLAKNVYVKIPITFTNGSSTLTVIEKLISKKINLNITAIFTIDQIKEIMPVINSSKSVLSVFAGRLFDIGIDAKLVMNNMSSYIHKNSNCELLWASSRMHYDLLTAQETGCDIITMTSGMYKKLTLIGKDPHDYSLETVKMFYKDAKESGFEI